MSYFPRKNALLGAYALIVLAFVTQGLFFISANAQTFDEASHLAAGYSYLARGDFRLNREHPGLIKELAALPIYLWYRLPFEPDEQQWNAANEFGVGKQFLYESSVPADSLLALARMPNLLLGALLVALIGRWSYRLWGAEAAILGMVLAAFDPNLVAHSCLVTTDIGVTLFVFATLYLFWEFSRSHNYLLFACAALTTGLALTSKYSAVLVPAMAVLCFGVDYLTSRCPSCSRLLDEKAFGDERWKKRIVALLSICVLLMLPMVVVYGTKGPKLWWMGFEDFFFRQSRGHAAYLLGEYSLDGWWSYFPIAFSIKTPIPTLFLMAASLVLCKIGRRFGRHEWIYLVLPALLWFVAATQAHFNIGLRHILPVYPFLFVIASRLATIQLARPWLARAMLIATVLLTIASALRMAPHQLSYFNEWIGGPDQGYKYLSDSNVDWGQDIEAVKAYMDREGVPIIYLSYFGTAPPAYYGIRYQYAPGFVELGTPPSDLVPPGERDLFVISVANLQGVYLVDPNTYRWLDSREPVARIAYSLLVYDLTSDADAHLQLAKIYWKHRLVETARHELTKALSLAPATREARELLDLLP